MTRRRFLGLLGGLGAAVVAPNVMSNREPGKGSFLSAPRFLAYPFSLGVASGDPLPDGVVLWTRLAPEPLTGGGMPRRNVAVRWEIAGDEGFRNVVGSGTTLATPERAHSVHVEVQGLEPARHYWYRFEAGGITSPVGRTKTAPALGASLSSMRFAFASCQYWEAGYYPAYRAMAEEDLDLVLHLGDYIYEWGPMTGGPRMHETPAPTTLASYRDRYALYKTDLDLQAAHANHPWVVVPDDHEGDNNHVDLAAEHGWDHHRALVEREAAFRAYYEHMPLRRAARPEGASMDLYRRLDYGDLARISVLDTRQYRTEVPCGYGLERSCAAALDEAATMTGPEQETWLLKGLGASPARWNVVAQQTLMAEYNYRSRRGRDRYDMDTWAGYGAARNRILSYLQKRRPSNPVVVSGDMHAAWVNDLKADFRDEDSATVATEFVGTSVTSTLADSWVRRHERGRGENPHVKHFDGRPGGYALCGLTREQWRTDFRLADSILDPHSKVRTAASFVIEDGRPGATRI